MQQAGFLKVNDRKLLVLYRLGKHGVHLKMRTTGKDGKFLPDESAALSDGSSASREMLSLLINGSTVYL